MSRELFCNMVLAGISTFLVFEYYHTFFERKIQKVNKVITFIYFIWQLFSITPIENISSQIRLSLSVLFVIIVSLNFSGEVLAKLVFAIIYNVLWMLDEILTGCYFLVFGISIEENKILGSLASKIFLFLLIKALQRFFHHHNISGLSWKDNAMLMLLPLGSMFIAHYLFLLSNLVGENKYIWISFLLFVAIFVINIVIFSIYIRLSEHFELRRKNSIYKMELNLYREHMKDKESVMREFRNSRHDFKHKLIYLLELSKNKKYVELDTYIKELLDVKDGLAIAHSDNLLIDALVNYKYQTAKCNGINVQATLDIPISFPFDNTDICVILGNALDNAIEANLRGNIKDPYIKLKMRYDGGNLLIILENAFDGKIKKDKKGMIITQKEDSQNHGIGLGSIQNTLKKYHGSMNIKTSDKKFKIIIIMYPMTEE